MGTTVLAVGVHASQPAETVRPKADITARHLPYAAAQAPIDRSLIDRYCVTCHNQKLKTGDLVRSEERRVGKECRL